LEAIDMRIRNLVLLAETNLAYAIPAYLWLWGVLTLPLWIRGAELSEAGSVWNLATVIGGFLGAIGTIALLALALLNTTVRPIPLGIFATLSFTGVLSVWAILTSHFEAFDLPLITLIVATAPTLCTAHLVVSCAQRRGSHQRQIAVD
jgi:hypothetical protein